MGITRLRKQIHAAKADLNPAFPWRLQGLWPPQHTRRKFAQIGHPTVQLFWGGENQNVPVPICNRLRFAENYTACSLTRKRPQLSIFSYRTVAAQCAKNFFLCRVALTASFFQGSFLYLSATCESYVRRSCSLASLAHVTGLSRLGSSLVRICQGYAAVYLFAFCVASWVAVAEASRE